VCWLPWCTHTHVQLHPWVVAVLRLQVTGRTALELGTLHDTLATMPVSAAED